MNWKKSFLILFSFHVFTLCRSEDYDERHETDYKVLQQQILRRLRLEGDLKGEVDMPLPSDTTVDLDKDKKLDIDLRSEIRVTDCNMYDLDSLEVKDDVEGYEDRWSIKMNGVYHLNPLFLKCVVEFDYGKKKDDRYTKHESWELYGYTTKEANIVYDMMLRMNAIIFSKMDFEAWPKFKFVLKYPKNMRVIGAQIVKQLPKDVVQTMNNWLLNFLKDQFESSNPPLQNECKCYSDPQRRTGPRLSILERKTSQQMLDQRTVTPANPTILIVETTDAPKDWLSESTPKKTSQTTTTKKASVTIAPDPFVWSTDTSVSSTTESNHSQLLRQAEDPELSVDNRDQRTAFKQAMTPTTPPASQPGPYAPSTPPAPPPGPSAPLTPPAPPPGPSASLTPPAPPPGPPPAPSTPPAPSAPSVLPATRASHSNKKSAKGSAHAPVAPASPGRPQAFSPKKGHSPIASRHSVSREPNDDQKSALSHVKSARKPSPPMTAEKGEGTSDDQKSALSHVISARKPSPPMTAERGEGTYAPVEKVQEQLERENGGRLPRRKVQPASVDVTESDIRFIDDDDEPDLRFAIRIPGHAPVHLQVYDHVQTTEMEDDTGFDWMADWMQDWVEKESDDKIDVTEKEDDDLTTVSEGTDTPASAATDIESKDDDAMTEDPLLKFLALPEFQSQDSHLQTGSNSQDPLIAMLEPKEYLSTPSPAGVQENDPIIVSGSKLNPDSTTKAAILVSEAEDPVVMSLESMQEVESSSSKPLLSKISELHVNALMPVQIPQAANGSSSNSIVHVIPLSVRHPTEESQTIIPMAAAIVHASIIDKETGLNKTVTSAFLISPNPMDSVRESNPHATPMPDVGPRSGRKNDNMDEMGTTPYAPAEFDAPDPSLIDPHPYPSPPDPTKDTRKATTPATPTRQAVIAIKMQELADLLKLSKDERDFGDDTHLGQRIVAAAFDQNNGDQHDGVVHYPGYMTKTSTVTKNGQTFTRMEHVYMDSMPTMAPMMPMMPMMPMAPMAPMAPMNRGPGPSANFGNMQQNIMTSQQMSYGYGGSYVASGSDGENAYTKTNTVTNQGYRAAGDAYSNNNNMYNMNQNDPQVMSTGSNKNRGDKNGRKRYGPSHKRHLPMQVQTVSPAQSEESTTMENDLDNYTTTDAPITDRISPKGKSSNRRKAHSPKRMEQSDDQSSDRKKAFSSPKRMEHSFETATMGRMTPDPNPYRVAPVNQATQWQSSSSGSGNMMQTNSMNLNGPAIQMNMQPITQAPMVMFTMQPMSMQQPMPQPLPQPLPQPMPQPMSQGPGPATNKVVVKPKQTQGSRKKGARSASRKSHAALASAGAVTAAPVKTVTETTVTPTTTVSVTTVTPTTTVTETTVTPTTTVTETTVTPTTTEAATTHHDDSIVDYVTGASSTTSTKKPKRKRKKKKITTTTTKPKVTTTTPSDEDE